MKQITYIAALTVSALLFSSPVTAKDYGHLYNGLEKEISQVSDPDIPSLRISIAEVGGKGDGIFLNTDAFQSAIDSLEARGGGHLDVPQGLWLTGPIRLKDRIDLHLDDNAVILLTPDKRQHVKDGARRAVPGISAEKVSDISISGNGVIDGNGKYWRYAKKSKMSSTEWKDLTDMGGTVEGSNWFPYGLNHFNSLTASPKDEENLRAHMINFNHCRNVKISGVTVKDSPRFHIMITRCSNVIVDSVSVRCPWNAQNGDGIDIGNSNTVLVHACRVDVGDDGICLKGGSGEKGLKSGPCRDILVCNCKVLRAHGGFVMGSDISGGAQNIFVRDCVFDGTDVGLRFKSAIGRGGHTENIFISDIVMVGIRGAAIEFNCDYADITYKNNSASDVRDIAFAPDFANMDIRRVTCRECKWAVSAAGIQGIKAVHDIKISDCTFFHNGKEAFDIDEKTADIGISDTRCFSFDY